LNAHAAHRDRGSRAPLARAIAATFALQRDKIVTGITNDNLSTPSPRKSKRARLFKRRVSPELYPRNFTTARWSTFS